VGLCLTWWLPSEYRWHPLLKMLRSESSVILFLVPCHKVWLMPTARVPCSNAANEENARIGHKVNFAPGRIPLGGKSPQNMYIWCTNPTDGKHHAEFGWPPLNDIGAVTKPRREARWNLMGCPKLANRSQPLVGRSPYCEDVWEILLFNKFFSNCRYMP